MIICLGSTGDILPMLALVPLLRDIGLTPVMLTHYSFKQLCDNLNVPLYNLNVDSALAMESVVNGLNFNVITP